MPKITASASEPTITSSRRGCGRRTRRRLAAPSLPGTRHPLLVRTGSETALLVTSWAVLHGTAESPCVAAWDAPIAGPMPISWSPLTRN